MLIRTAAKRLLVMALLAAASRPALADDPKLELVLADLASAHYATREAAQRQLERMPASLEAILDRLKAEKDPEVAARLNEVVPALTVTRVETQKTIAPARWWHVTGKIAEGFAGVEMRVVLLSLGPDVAQALNLKGLTDAGGRFDITVPFGELVYQVLPCAEWPRPPLLPVLPDVTGDVGTVTFRIWNNQQVNGKVLDEAGQPAVKAEVRLVGDQGLGPVILTDGQGKFSSAAPILLGNSVRAWAHLGERTSLLPVVGQDAEWLQLGKGGSVGGVARDDVGRVVAGVKVTLVPDDVRELHFDAVTDAQGRFVFQGLPVRPGGTRYEVTAQGAGFGKTRSFIVGGDVGEDHDLVLERMPVIIGRVVNAKGEPVAGAWVAQESDPVSPPRYTEQWQRVFTDANGRFVIAALHTGTAIHLEVLSGKDGFLETKLDPLAAGAIVQKEFVLQGMVRARGTVTNAAGKPLSNIVCVDGATQATAWVTGSDGKYDTGALPATGANHQIIFRAPRPENDWKNAEWEDFNFRIYRSIPTYYQHQAHPLPAVAGELKDLNIKLPAAELLHFKGTVQDSGGQPLARVPVYLMTGEAQGTDWLNADKMREVDASPVILWIVRTTQDGRFSLWTVRESGIGMVRGNATTDWKTYCVGANGTSTRLIRGIEVPKETGTREGTIVVP